MRINCKSVVLLSASLTCAACAHRPVVANWRLIKQGAGDLLVPPGVARPDLARRTFAVNVAVGQGVCPPSIRVRGKRVLVTVNRDMLSQQRAGWLTSWTAGLESRNCIASGEGSVLAARMAESLPFDPALAFHLLYPDDLIPPIRLEVVTPILYDDAKPVFTEEQVSGGGNQLNLVLKTDNLIGYETGVYAVQANPSGAGYRIVPLYADRHVDQTVERRARPAVNYFQFPEASFFRLFVKSGQTEYTALAIGAATRAEVDHLAADLDAGTATCATLGAKSCIAIPRRVALNAVTPVTINSAEVLVRWGANLAEAIRTAGERRPESVLATLAVSRLYSGRPTPVDFDHSSPAILQLPVTGGEVISWKQ